MASAKRNRIDGFEVFKSMCKLFLNQDTMPHENCDLLRQKIIYYIQNCSLLDLSVGYILYLRDNIKLYLKFKVFEGKNISMLNLSVLMGDKLILEALVKQGVNINGHGRFMDHALHIAIITNRFDMITNLANLGAELNEFSDHHHPLGFCFWNRKTLAFRMFLELGANPDCYIQTGYGKEVLLTYCVEEHKLDYIELLLSYKANPLFPTIAWTGNLSYECAWHSYVYSTASEFDKQICELFVKFGFNIFIDFDHGTDGLLWFQSCYTLDEDIINMGSTIYYFLEKKLEEHLRNQKEKQEDLRWIGLRESLK